jgi:hypothetical protein
MLGRLKLDDPLVGELADASAAIGDRRMIAPLRTVLAVVQKRSARYLDAKADTKMQAPVFSESVAGHVGRALLVFADTESYEGILQLILLHRGRQGLTLANPLLLSKSGVMVSSSYRPRIEAAWTHIIGYVPFCSSSRYWAILAAGEHRCTLATDSLQRSLTQTRSSRLLMQSSAWALERITKKPTSCGQPIQNEGQWVVRIAR